MSRATSADRTDATTARPLSRDDYRRHLPMVRRIAMRIGRSVPRHVEIADLVSCGWVGLVEAARRAGAMSESEFEAYASHRVRGAMLDYLRGLDPATRRVRGASRRIQRAVQLLSSSTEGRAPEEAEIARHLGLGVEPYRKVLQEIASAGMARLHLVDPDEIESDASSQEEEVERRDLTSTANAAIKTLPQRTQQILALYYQEGCSLRQIGAALGVTESRVSQIHTEAMHRLRAAIGTD